MVGGQLRWTEEHGAKELPLLPQSSPKSSEWRPLRVGYCGTSVNAQQGTLALLSAMLSFGLSVLDNKVLSCLGR